MAASDDRPVGVERLLFLRSLSPARALGSEAMQMAGAMRDVYFQRGQELFALGAVASEVFFIVKGAVRMTSPDSDPWDFEAPAIVGALDAFAGRPRSRRGVAVSDVHALALLQSDWLAVLEEHPDFACESALRLSAMLGRRRLGIPGDGGYPPPPPATEPLARGLDLLQKALAFRRLPLFRAAGVEATLRVVDLAREVVLAPGSVLFREGEPADALDVVAGGLVAVDRAASPLTATFGPGSLVGGTAALGFSEHPFTARSEEGAVVLRVRRDDVLDVMEEHFELTRAMLSTLNTERDEIMRRHGLGDERAAAGPEAAPPSTMRGPR